MDPYFRGDAPDSIGNRLEIMRAEAMAQLYRMRQLRGLEPPPIQDRFVPVQVDWDSPDWSRDYYGYKNMGYPVVTKYSWEDEAILASLRISRC